MFREDDEIYDDTTIFYHMRGPDSSYGFDRVKRGHFIEDDDIREEEINEDDGLGEDE